MTWDETWKIGEMAEYQGTCNHVIKLFAQIYSDMRSCELFDTNIYSDIRIRLN